jgi:integrase
MNKTLYRTLYARWKRRDKTDVHVFQFDQDQLDHLMKELCKKAGVKHFGFHAIRHHVASVINDSRKASMKQIQGLLGHKRQSTTEEYLHVIGSALYDAAGILDDEGERERKKIKVVPQVVPRGS